MKPANHIKAQSLSPQK